MATGALYFAATGLITQTISPPLSDAAQLSGLADAGLLQVIIPDGKNGGTGMIDLTSKQYVDYTPAPIPPPNIVTQLVAALINAGTVTSDSFHPATLVEANQALSAAGLQPVAVTLPTAAKVDSITG